MLSDPDTARPLLLLLLLLLRLDIAFVSFTPDSAAQQRQQQRRTLQLWRGMSRCSGGETGQSPAILCLVASCRFQLVFYGYKFLHLF